MRAPPLCHGNDSCHRWSGLLYGRGPSLLSYGKKRVDPMLTPWRTVRTEITNPTQAEREEDGWFSIQRRWHEGEILRTDDRGRVRPRDEHHFSLRQVRCQGLIPQDRRMVTES